MKTRTIAALTLSLLALAVAIFAGCAALPETPGDALWYGIFEEVQATGGTCEVQTLAYRNRIHVEIGVPYDRMRLVRSWHRSSGEYHLRLWVQMTRTGEWRTFDPANNGFNWLETGEVYWEHDTTVVFPGDYRLPGTLPADFTAGPWK